MSETTTEAAGTQPVTSEGGIPAEVSAKVHAAIEEIKELSGKEALGQYAHSNGLWDGLNIKSVDDATEGWLRKRLKRDIQAKIFKENGIQPSEAVKKEDAKHDKMKVEGEETGEKKVGRKRMNTAGIFKIVLAEGQGGGRSGSYKGKIVADLKDLESFSYERFKEAVAKSYGFGTDAPGDTNFKDLDTATAAWFSELKNKQYLVVEVTAI